eukprot:Awhi_evm1s1168
MNNKDKNNCVQNWTKEDVLYWVDSLDDLHQYFAIFQDHDISGKGLGEITMEKLEWLGVTKQEDRASLYSRIRQLVKDSSECLGSCCNVPPSSSPDHSFEAVGVFREHPYQTEYETTTYTSEIEPLIARAGSPPHNPPITHLLDTSSSTIDFSVELEKSCLPNKSSFLGLEEKRTELTQVKIKIEEQKALLRQTSHNLQVLENEKERLENLIDESFTQQQQQQQLLKKQDEFGRLQLEQKKEDAASQTQIQNSSFYIRTKKTRHYLQTSDRNLVSLNENKFTDFLQDIEKQLWELIPSENVSLEHFLIRNKSTKEFLFYSQKTITTSVKGSEFRIKPAYYTNGKEGSYLTIRERESKLFLEESGKDIIICHEGDSGGSENCWHISPFIITPTIEKSLISLHIPFNIGLESFSFVNKFISKVLSVDDAQDPRKLGREDRKPISTAPHQYWIVSPFKTIANYNKSSICNTSYDICGSTDEYFYVIKNHMNRKLLTMISTDVCLINLKEGEHISDHQKWSFIPQANDYYQLKNKATGNLVNLNPYNGFKSKPSDSKSEQ